LPILSITILELVCKSAFKALAHLLSVWQSFIKNASQNQMSLPCYIPWQPWAM